MPVIQTPIRKKQMAFKAQDSRQFSVFWTIEGKNRTAAHSNKADLVAVPNAPCGFFRKVSSA